MNIVKMNVASQPLISCRQTKNLSPLDRRFNCTGKWRRTSSSSSCPASSYFLKNCNGSWRRTSSPIPDRLKNFNDTMSQRRCRRPSLLKEPIVAKPSACTNKQLLNGESKVIIIKRGENLPESLKKEIMWEGVLKESKFFSSASFMSFDSPSPSSLPIPSFLGNKKTVIFNMDDQALDLELMEFGFFAAAT